MMYAILKGIAFMLIFLTVRLEIKGRELIPDTGPLLVVANHLSVGDPVFLGTSLKRKVDFMAKEELFKNPITGYFVRQFGAFPVYRGGANVETLRQADRVLKNGQVLCMFPEGKRSHGNGLLPGLNGSAMIALHNRVPILPVGIIGADKIHGYWWMWHRPKVTLEIGPVFYLTENEVILRKTQLSQYTEIIMNHIAELLPEAYRGEYARK